MATTYNKGKIYVWDNQKKSVREEQYDNNTYKKYQEQGRLATPQEYADYKNNQYAKGFVSNLSRDSLNGIINKAREWNPQLQYNLGTRDYAIRYLKANPQEAAQYGYKPPVSGSYTQDPNDYIAQNTVQYKNKNTGEIVNNVSWAPAYQSDQWENLGNTTAPITKPTGQSGQQLTDEELQQTIKQGNRLFTQQTGGFTPSSPEALAAAGTMSSETVKPTFQTSGGQTQPQTVNAATTNNQSYYGSLQDLANKGLQVSGDKVYSNGQVVGSYGGINEPGTNTPKLNPDIVDANTLADAGNVDFHTVADQKVIDVAGVTDPIVGGEKETPQYGLTEGEKKAEGVIGDIQNIYKELEGESAFRTAEEKKAGLPGLQDTLTDLQTQLQALRNEASGIPLAVENDAARRGITTTIAGGQEQALLRQNAIKALNIATQISATQGLITTAQNYADRAVEAEFGPIKAKLQTALANLDLLQKSPEYTREQKNQALAMQQILTAQQREVANQEADKKAVNDITIAVAQNVADARALNAISNAGSELEAIQMAGRLATESGWQYVDSPQKRDDLASQGYEIYENRALGRTYARKPASANEAVQSYVNQINAGNMKISSVPADMRDAVVSALGTTSLGGGTGGRGGVSSQGKSQWTPDTVKQLYQQYIDSGAYSAQDALKRVEELTGYVPKESNYTSSTIPKELKNEVITKIQNEVTLDELARAYPEISSSYLNSLYNQYKPNSSSNNEMSDKEFLQLLGQ